MAASKRSVRTVAGKVRRSLAQAVSARVRQRSFRKRRREMDPALRAEFREKFQTSKSFARGVHYATAYETEPIRANHILYESFRGETFGGNPFALFRHMLDNPAYPDLTHVISVQDTGSPAVQPYASHPNVVVVETESTQYISLVQSCKYLVNDTAFHSHFIKRDEQVYLFAWSGSVPFRKLAAHRGHPWEAADTSKSLLNCDYLVSPNSHDTDTLLDAYYADALFSGTRAAVSYPRNELMTASDPEEVRAALQVPAGKKLVLYAPAVRYSSTGSAAGPAAVADYRDQLQSALGDDYVVALQLHPSQRAKLRSYDSGYVVPAGMDTHEVLAATDILVSDYSGLLFDFTLSGRPMVCFAFDREAEETTRGGFYLPIEDLPCPVCTTVEDAARAIVDAAVNAGRYADRYQDIRQRLVGTAGEHSCEHLACLLLGDGSLAAANMDDRLVLKKRRILMCRSVLAPNGVTESFMSLLSNIDFDKNEVTVVIPKSARHRDRQRDIPPQVRLCHFDTPLGTTEDEWVQIQQFEAIGLNASDNTAVLEECMKRNLRRLFGSAQFDVVINYSGYKPTWALMLALGSNARRRVVYMHTDLTLALETKNPFIASVFASYRFHDALFSVSEGTMKRNRKGAGRYTLDHYGFSIDDRLDYVLNLINADRIQQQATAFVEVADGGHSYLRHPATGSPNTISLVAKPQPENVNFVMVGRLDDAKRHDRALKAFALLHAEHPNSRLYIVGDGQLLPKLKGLATRLGIAESVIFTGHVSNPYPFIALCDCLILPSDREGQPVVILEALTLGKPVIATNIPGSRDLLQPNYGILTKRSAVALFEAMRDFVAHGSSADSFDYHRYNEEALRIFYEHVCDGKADEKPLPTT